MTKRPNKLAKPPTLLDPKGMGGIVAQDGFDYQVAVGLINLPAWLANPGFEQLIFEGLEDVEARFFNPYAPKLHVLERMQAKSGGLNKSEVKAVFDSFKAFDDHHPHTAQLHTLVTPQLPVGLVWVSRDTKRVRNARPFYAPFGDVTLATDVQLRTSFQNEFGSALGEFACSAVEVKLEPVTDDQQAAARFVASLTAAFPDTDSFPSSYLKQIFRSLKELAGRRRGQPLGRTILLEEIRAVLGRPLMPVGGFPLHIRSSRQEEPHTRALEIDASAFSGPGGKYPPTVTWSDQLTAPLRETSGWLSKTGQRQVALSGGYRISTGLLLGWCFRSAIGFELEVPTKEGAWRTDARGQHSVPGLSVAQASELANGVLNVSVGILRDPSTTLAQAGLRAEQVLRINLSGPVTSAEMTQALVGQVRSAVSQAVGCLQPGAIHMYFAGPAVVAVALGHRWNAMPRTQLHEFDVERQQYQQTAILA